MDEDKKPVLVCPYCDHQQDAIMLGDFDMEVCDNCIRVYATYENEDGTYTTCQFLEGIINTSE